MQPCFLGLLRRSDSLSPPEKACSKPESGDHSCSLRSTDSPLTPGRKAILQISFRHMDERAEAQAPRLSRSCCFLIVAKLRSPRTGDLQHWNPRKTAKVCVQLLHVMTASSHAGVKSVFPRARLQENARLCGSSWSLILTYVFIRWTEFWSLTLWWADSWF